MVNVGSLSLTNRPPSDTEADFLDKVGAEYIYNFFPFISFSGCIFVLIHQCSAISFPLKLGIGSILTLFTKKLSIWCIYIIFVDKCVGGHYRGLLGIIESNLAL